jgi:hypothetical protein
MMFRTAPFARALLAFSLVLALPVPAQPQAAPGFAMAAGKTSSTMPFALIDNRVFVDVRLNGRGPFHFILDTGAGGFAMYRNVADQLGVRVEDAGEGRGVGEKTVRSGSTRISELRCGDLTFTNVAFDVLPVSDSDQVFGTKPVDGIFGQDVFENVVVKHDYLHETLTFTLPAAYDYKGSGAIVRFSLPAQIPVVDAELDGVAGKFGIDTGARSALLLYGPFVARNDLVHKYDATLEGVTGWGIGGPVRSLLARAKELTLGDVSVHDLVIRLSTQKAGLTTTSSMAGLIGPDVLSQFDVTFDYARSRIIFEKNANYGRRDSYDRAGVWMGQAGKHFAAVDVIAGGPAAEAGVKTGDTILAIDGVDTGKLILPDVRERIRREAPGKTLNLLLDSHGQQRVAMITLRDLV